jgi:para-aminobenzoate synthetase component 1
VKDYILAGDIFEANISQRFSADLLDRPFDLYRRLREINPATFSAYLAFDDTILASASPERFLKLTHGQVETRPIKGTRPRGKTAQEDQAFANELMKSEKDHAENVMIVDLLRNDLSRVCEDHSVQVPQLCGLESYPAVHHLVSVVTGKLTSKLTAVDLLRATFPGGSITGAPKIRAMEIIAEIEPTRRGPYCGSIGYIGFNGDMDTSIAIRTYAIKNNKVTFQAGGAVVVDSDPVDEYEETLTKARALKKALIEEEEYDLTYR